MDVERRTSVGWDLNCDLGEGESPDRTESLFAVIHSANVACGGHAGDAATMLQCARWAVNYGVRLGAHPGVPGQFGRGAAPLTPGALANLVGEQLREFRRCVGGIGSEVHHVKLHGSLYHLSDSTVEHARAYLQAVQAVDPTLRVYARAGGRVAGLGAAVGLEVWPEVFLDRAYRPDGQLVGRDQPGALLQASAVMDRFDELRTIGYWRAEDGTWLSQPWRTLCLHGDGAGVAELAARISDEMTTVGPPPHVLAGAQACPEG